jgi:hypothetical protein
MGGLLGDGRDVLDPDDFADLEYPDAEFLRAQLKYRYLPTRSSFAAVLSCAKANVDGTNSPRAGIFGTALP